VLNQVFALVVSSSKQSNSCEIDDARRFLIISIYSGLSSIPRNFLPYPIAAIPVVPAPANGSRTTPSIGQPARTQRRARSGGIHAKCAPGKLCVEMVNTERPASAFIGSKNSIKSSGISCLCKMSSIVNTPFVGYNKSMITLKCEQCENSYQTKPYMARISQRHFCGMSCYAEWQKVHRVGIGRNRVSVPCNTCHAIIEKQPSTVNVNNFCSRKCWGIWRASGIYSGANNPTWLGGSLSYRGENWNKQRKAARLRDGDTCQHCGKQSSNLPVHHIKPFHLFANYLEANVLDNLTALCPKCHSTADNQFWKDNSHLMKSRRFPDCSPIKECKKCCNDFQPRSGASMLCDKCCTAICQHCSNQFYSRKASFRIIKYCSRSCRNAAIRKAS